MVLILYKNTNIFGNYMLILHKLTLCFYLMNFVHPVLTHSSTKQKLTI